MAAILSRGRRVDSMSIGLEKSTELQLTPEQDDRHLADDISECIFLTETFCILIQILLKFVRESQFDDKSTLIK